MIIRRKEPRAPVDRTSALNQAQLAVRRAWAGGIDDLQAWGPGEFDPEPLVIHDLNGEPLFYDFTVREGKREIGRTRTAASKLVGSPVVAIERGLRGWDVAKAPAMAVAAARKAYPRRDVAAKEFVCYSYPKIGVRVEIDAGKGGSIIVDVADGSIVQGYGAEEEEGQTAWSFLEHRPPSALEQQLRRYAEAEHELDLTRKATKEMFNIAFTARELTTMRARFQIASDYQFQMFSSRVLRYGPRCNPHECFMLYAQQTNVYCAVATGQMILDFYRRPFSQTAIAAAMGTGATGTSQAGQETGYQSLSNGCLDAWHDYSAEWAEAKAEIDANRPLKSGIPGHARACTGWKRQNFSLSGATSKRWLQIHDPWPWNADLCAGGAVYWEDWESVTHTNWCYVRHRTTAHA